MNADANGGMGGLFADKDVVSVKKFEKMLPINAPADKVFTAASDVTKMPKWMPAKLHEELVQPNTVGRFDIAEYLQRDSANKQLSWDDGQGYKGSLKITNAGQKSEVTFAVSSTNPTVTEDEINKFLTQALTSLDKQIMANR